MIFKKLFQAISILIVIFFTSQSVTAQVYNLDNAITSPDSVTQLYVELSTSNSKIVSTLFSKLSKLESLQIRGMTNENIFTLNEIKKVRSITFIDLDEVSFYQFFESLEKISTLEELIFVNCQIENVEYYISILSNIRKLEIRKCDNVNYNKIVDVTSKLKNLTNLSFPMNELSDLPQEIKKLKQVSAFDISNNSLETLPLEISEMSNLDTLYANGNLFIDPITALTPLKKLHLKYLTIDALIVDEITMSELQKLLPNITIIAVPGELTIDKLLPDSLVISSKNNNSQSENQGYGEFQLEKTSLKVFSDAYSHYKWFFEPRFPFTEIDSLTFDERFESLDYINCILKKTLNRSYYTRYMYFYSKKKKDKNINLGNLCFTLKKSKEFGYYFIIDLGSKNNSGEYSSSYPELEVFSKYKWRYKGDLSPKEFKKKYIYRNKKRVTWNDIKIISGDNYLEYTFILKEDSSFTTLICNPIIENQKDNIPSFQQQKMFKKNYERYLTIRKRRAISWNKYLIRSRKELKKQQLKDYNQKWLEFQNLYMSEEEKKLTREEWLDYYETVMNDEANVLLNSDATLKNIVIALIANNYKLTSINSTRNNRAATTTFANFYSPDNRLISVNEIIVVNKTRHSYYSIRGSLTNKMNGFTLDDKDDCVIIIENIKKETFVINSDEIKNKTQNTNVCNLNSILINKKIGTVSQVFNLLNL